MQAVLGYILSILGYILAILGDILASLSSGALEAIGELIVEFIYEKIPKWWRGVIEFKRRLKRRIAAFIYKKIPQWWRGVIGFKRRLKRV